MFIGRRWRERRRGGEWKVVVCGLIYCGGGAIDVIEKKSSDYHIRNGSSHLSEIDGGYTKDE